MDTEKARTLTKNFPDVMLALIQRMNPEEREELLSEFQTKFPKDFQAWMTCKSLNFT
jgi:hypothetical protein